MSTYPGECSGDTGCSIHPGMQYAHMPWGNADPIDVAQDYNVINAALECAIGESWEGEESWSWIAARWIEHMATTHGAHCPGRGCLATADAPAYVGALRRMRRDASKYGAHADSIWRAGYRDAIRDLANELGVDLDG